MGRIGEGASKTDGTVYRGRRLGWREMPATERGGELLSGSVEAHARNTPEVVLAGRYIWQGLRGEALVDGHWQVEWRGDSSIR